MQMLSSKISEFETLMANQRKTTRTNTDLPQTYPQDPTLFNKYITQNSN